MENEIKQIYKNRFEIKGSKVTINKSQQTFYSKYHWLDFVKRHKNVFNDKTIYRVKEYNIFYIVKEFNYFQGEKNIWLWLYDMENNIYFVVENLQVDLYSMIEEIYKLYDLGFIDKFLKEN